jgi:hypothetical protein
MHAVLPKKRRLTVARLELQKANTGLPIFYEVNAVHFCQTKAAAPELAEAYFL